MSRSTANRIRLLDILRGFAILGTLGTNVWIFAHLGDVNYIFTFKPYGEWWSSLDSFLRNLILVLINGKLLSLLAIMFGVGLELKYQQSLRKGQAWPGVYLWVCFFLMLEGFLNFTFVMEYDILMSYAMTVVVVAWVVKKGIRAIKIAMLTFGSFSLLMYLGFTLLQIMGEISGMGDMTSVTQLYQHGTWVDQIRYRLANFWELRVEIFLAFTTNVFLFFTGVLLMRKGAFASNERGRKIRQTMLKYGIGIGLPLNFLLFIPGTFDFLVRYIFSAVLSIGYIGMIAWLVEKRENFWLWGLFENVGKMSLSCYLMQSSLCAIIFNGWGFGLGNQLNSLGVLAVWFLISLLQIIIAGVWLRFMNLGPMETGRKFFLNKLSGSS